MVLRPPEASGVFVDSSALYAFFDPRDSREALARAIFRRLVSHGRRLVTTNFVRAETHALLTGRAYHKLGIDLIDFLEAGPVTVVPVSAEVEERGISIVRRYGDKTFSIADATSFVIMDRLGISVAMSFDDDFRQFGIIIAQP